MSDTKKNGNPISGKNHYETLGLARNCSEKDVRNAFVSLSKLHHPDVNPSDPNQNAKFVKINEAYSVLSRLDKRSIYDSDLLAKEAGWSRGRGFRVETSAPRYASYNSQSNSWTFQDESFYSMRDKSGFNRNAPYYGIRGINRVSNNRIAAGAVLLMLCGAILHYTAYKYSLAFNVKRIQEQNNHLSTELSKVKRSAERNGNDAQIEAFRNRLGWDGNNK